MKGKYLINTDNWFVAPDGNQYKAVWGNIEILQDDNNTAQGSVKANRGGTVLDSFLLRSFISAFNTIYITVYRESFLQTYRIPFITVNLADYT